MKSFLISLMVISGSAWAIEKQDAASIAPLIQEAIIKNQEAENAGVAVAIFNHKEIIHAQGYGYADKESKKPVSMQTAFAIGSTTKAFTSLGLKLLENEGKLAITDKVISHLPDFKLSNQNIANQATIEDLLSHRVGMPRHDLMWLYTPFNREENYHRLQYLAFPDKAEENFRKNFVYNNFMYMVAGKIIETQSGQSYEDFIRERIFKTLNMQNSFMTVPAHYADLAEPYFREVKVPHRDISDMGPAGSIYSTAEDMAKWIQSLMNKKWQNQDDLFRARVAIDSKQPSLEYGYGLAWMVNTTNKNFSLYLHDGNIDGFSAFVLFSPELDIGAVILINQNGSGIGHHIATALLKYEIAKRPINKSFTNKASIKFPKFDKSFPLNVQTEVKREGEKQYSDPGYGIISTYVSDGKSFVDYYGNVWEAKPFEHEYFNLLVDLVLGANHYDFPIKATDDVLVAPFQSEVPMIEFKAL